MGANYVPSQIDDIVGLRQVATNQQLLMYGLNAAGGNGEFLSSTGTTSSNFRATSSTFASWGFPIGPKQGFNRTVFDITAWNAALLPSQVRVRIKVGDVNGTVLADSGVKAISTVLGVNTIAVDVGTVIENAGAANLWMEFYTNGHCAPRVTGTVLYATPQTMYYAATTPSTDAGIVVNTNTSGAQTNIYAEFYRSAVESIQEVTAGSVFGVVSTFTGWESAIGQKTKFNRVTLTLRWWDKSVAPPTQIRLVIRDAGPTLPATNGYQGNILADLTVNVPSTIPYNQDFQLDFDLDETVNTSNYLWLGYYANSRVGTREISGNPYNAANYGQTRYVTSGQLSNAGAQASGTQANIWTKMTYINHKLDAYASAEDAKDKVQEAALAAVKNVKISLPPTIYALEGRECNIYFKNFIRTDGFDLSLFRINVVCAKGKQQERRWHITPASSDAGSYTWGVEVYFNNELVASASATLVIKALTAGAGVTRKMIAIGDSTTANGLWLAEVVRLFVGDTAPMTLSLQGSIGMSANDSTTTSRTVRHDAVSGKTIDWQYANTGATLDATTNGNASAFRGGTRITSSYGSTGINSVNVIGTAGLVNGQTVWLGFGTANAEQLTVQSFTSTSVTFTENTTKTHSNDERLYWDSGSFSFTNYMTNQGITLASNDWVVIHLGINDIFSITDDAALYAKMATMVSQLDAMIVNMQAAVSGLRIGLLMTIPPNASQDAFAENYDSGQTLWRYNRNRSLWIEHVQKIFSSGYTGVHLLGFHLNLDTDYNFPTTSTAVNARNSTTYNRPSNGVHPDASGYYQMADTVRSILKAIES